MDTQVVGAPSIPPQYAIMQISTNQGHSFFYKISMYTHYLLQYDLTYLRKIS